MNQMGDQSDLIKIKNEEGTVFGFCSLRIESSYPLHNDNAKQRGETRPRCFAIICTQHYGGRFLLYWAEKYGKILDTKYFGKR